MHTEAKSRLRPDTDRLHGAPSRPSLALCASLLLCGAPEPGSAAAAELICNRMHGAYGASSARLLGRVAVARRHLNESTIGSGQSEAFASVRRARASAVLAVLTVLVKCLC